MYIHEAVKKAMETNGSIIRTDIDGGLPQHLPIKPTNSYRHCVVGKYNGIFEAQNWQPSESDLTVASWEVID